jgi:hypothetical protein
MKIEALTPPCFLVFTGRPLQSTRPDEPPIPLSLSLSLSLSARSCVCENLPDYALQSKLACWLMPGAMCSGSSLGRSMKKTGLKGGLTKGSSVHCPVRNKPPGKGCPTVQGQ